MEKQAWFLLSEMENDEGSTIEKLVRHTMAVIKQDTRTIL